MLDNRMNSSLQNTIQGQMGGSYVTNPINLLMLLARVNDLIAPWWSKRRDAELRQFVKSSDHLSSALYNMCAKMTAIPVKVQARDKSIKTHVAMANAFTDIIINGSQFGEGWAAFYSMFIDDLMSQDNGAFAEIIGPGDPSGPIEGYPISVAHLDASRCNRTGNPEYPVLYEDTSGKMYKLHYTRVLYASQMPSTQATMLGVGYSAVSRVLNATQNLIDISIYKQEKLGSRPQRQLLITGGGLDPEDIQVAVQMSERSMNNQGLSRFAKTIVAGNRNIPDPKIEAIDLAGVPDGFSEKESTILAMSVVAMGFGMDARELFPAMETGATKADAIVQHMKQRGKGPGQIIEMTEKLFDAKVLPPYLELVFDYQDDAQDRQIAEIRSIRSQARQRDLIGSITNQRIERQLMVENGEISQAQFEELELADGRLEDGLDIKVLFASDDKDYVSMLSGTTDANYETKMEDIQKLIMASKDVNLIKKARKALAAIHEKFVKPAEQEKMLEQRVALGAPTGRANSPTGKPDTSYQGEKFGRKLGRDESNIRGDQQGDIKA